MILKIIRKYPYIRKHIGVDPKFMDDKEPVDLPNGFHGMKG